MIDAVGIACFAAQPPGDLRPHRQLKALNQRGIPPIDMVASHRSTTLFLHGTKSMNTPYQGGPSGKERVRFISPSARAALTVSGDNPTWLRAQFRLLPRAADRPKFLPLALLGLDASGAPAAIPPIIVSKTPPNLYVAFVLQRMEHVVISGGGVPQSFVFWEGDSPVTTEDAAGPFTLPLPDAGGITIVPSDHANGIYQGFALNGCSSPSVSFPITMESWVREGEVDPVFGIPVPTGEEIGRVTLTDDDTITRSGFYNFRYVIRGQGTNGAVSDFTLSGIVLVNCNDNPGLG